MRELTRFELALLKTTKCIAYAEIDGEDFEEGIRYQVLIEHSDSDCMWFPVSYKHKLSTDVPVYTLMNRPSIYIKSIYVKLCLLYESERIALKDLCMRHGFVLIDTE